MDELERRRLEQAGWRTGTAEEFLELSPEEAAIVDLKLVSTESKDRERPDADGTRAKIREFDSAVLTRDLPEHGLKAGDVGTVVHCYESGQGFEVEFVSADGRTVAALTLTAAEVRPLEGREILHARPLST